MNDVLLVCMPFGPVFSPSIGLGLLKAALAAQHLPARVRYFSIDFAERVGQDFYGGLASEGRPSVRTLAGEWIFARDLFEAAPDAEEAYVDEVLRRRADTPTWTAEAVSPVVIRRIRRARGLVGPFLEGCAEEVVRSRPRLVGFTSVFQQHVAALALARRVKQALPETVVVFGGANCEGAMGAETVRQFRFVDAAVSGEGDLVLPELVRRVLEGRPIAGLPGVWTRERVEAELAAGRFGNAPVVRDLDGLPYPDYSDFFEQFRASRFGAKWQPSVFFETSRGCWWGERLHCTFCGLNGRTLAYRSKSARRALEELTWLTRRFPGSAVEVTDNILDLRYFEDFLPELAERRLGVSLYYETKANLRKEQVRLLREAGVRTLQPGIESFSDAVLKLMRKGVTGLQNVQLLKWCKQVGIQPYWNVLWGFPGEPPEEYARMARLVPLLTHLPPPIAWGGIRLDRFSPNFEDAARLGFAAVEPLAPYRHVYALPREALANLAYFFAFEYREPRDVTAYVRPLVAALRDWKRAAGRSELFSVDTGDRLFVWDLRPAAREPLTALAGAERLLYRASDAACGVRSLAETCGLPPAEVERRLEPLVESGLMLKDGARWLALALPLEEYAPGPRAVERFLDVARGLGRRATGGLIVPFAEPGRGRRPSRRTPRQRARRPPPLARAPGRFSLADHGELLIRLDT